MKVSARPLRTQRVKKWPNPKLACWSWWGRRWHKLMRAFYVELYIVQSVALLWDLVYLHNESRFRREKLDPSSNSYVHTGRWNRVMAISRTQKFALHKQRSPIRQSQSSQFVLKDSPVIAELSELCCLFSISVKFMCTRICIFVHVCKHKYTHFYLLLFFQVLVHECISLRNKAYNTRECMA